MREKAVSVCMAVYNGEKYLRQQIESILPQLDKTHDELIIVDDGSTDNSENIIRSYNSGIIHFYKNDINIGYKDTFEKAIQLSSNDMIFLSDQDDIWVDGRLNLMYNKLMHSQYLLICSNFKSFSNNSNTINRFKTQLKASDSTKNIKNILHLFKGDIAYFGCTMAFKKEFKNYILPFPSFVREHDHWIAVMGNILRKILHMDEVSLLHRIHSNNASFVNRKLKDKLYTRFLFLKYIKQALIRKLNNI